MGEQQVWSISKAQRWAQAQPWRTGCNFLPSTAINQLEMWQAETFDPDTIDRELALAAEIGMSLVRVYLHDIAWEIDPDGFLARVDQFLNIAYRRQISALFALFDDCHQPDGYPGPQPAPKPGVHNSGWVRSPSDRHRNWPEDWARLERYVTSVLTLYRDDPRVWMWDLYNEPGNSGYGLASLPLLEKVFEWAHAVRPSAPLTVGIWADMEELNLVQTQLSDVISFHHYGDAASLEGMIARMKAFGRPVVCTEWMARTHGSLVQSHLPIFNRTGIPCLNWGLVKGKSNTIYPWGSPEGAAEPEPWFHDLYHPDGRPYAQEEVSLFGALSRVEPRS